MVVDQQAMLLAVMREVEALKVWRTGVDRKLDEILEILKNGHKHS